MNFSPIAILQLHPTTLPPRLLAALPPALPTLKVWQLVLSSV